jgi:hypothetical protein
VIVKYTLWKKEIFFIKREKQTNLSNVPINTLNIIHTQNALLILEEEKRRRGICFANFLLFDRKYIIF